jgi:sugar O-acyltransferase (sialic acid O-acetyltransferase NeuD family)
MNLQLQADYDHLAVDDPRGNGTVHAVVCVQDASPSVAPRIVVIGCSGHARVVVDILEKESRCNVVGLLDSSKPAGTEVLGYRVVGSDDDLPALFSAKICEGVIVAIGDNWVRSRMVQRIRESVPEIRFFTAIHPSARIASDVSIGVGTVIMPGVVVNTGCHIGEFCILNTSSSLDHDSTMEPFSSLAPRAVTGGAVRIGAFTAICIGAVVSHSIRVGKHTVVGAGATVVRDIPDQVVAYGTPARIVRARKPGDSYLGERAKNETSPPNPTQAQETAGSFKSLLLIPSTNGEWNTYIGRSAHDFFHTSQYHSLSETCESRKAWLAVYGTVDKFVAWPYLLQDVDRLEGIEAGELRDVTSVYGYTGPLLFGCQQDEPFLASAWETMVEAWRSQSVVSVFTRFHPLLGNHQWPRGANGEKTTQPMDDNCGGKTVVIDLSGSEAETWNSYNRHLRQTLRRLLSLGVEVTPDPDWRHLNDFIRIYYSTMRRNNAAPFYLFPHQNLCKLKEALGSHGSLMVARYADEVIAAALLIEYAGIVTLFLLATHDRFTAMSPGKMVIHAAQTWARARGNRVFHLGGGRSSRNDDTLFRFKSWFSKRSYPFYVGHWILDQEVYHVLATARQKQAKRLSRGTDQTYFPAYRAPFEMKSASGKSCQASTPAENLNA